jgi:hypothetical protein
VEINAAGMQPLMIRQYFDELQKAQLTIGIDIFIKFICAVFLFAENIVKSKTISKFYIEIISEIKNENRITERNQR